MRWEKLLSTKILGYDKNEQKNNDSYDGRSAFQKDFDRVVFSSAFRRLQDKTQVFPLPESDFVHTRLTHSLEVSCVGRSLGNLVGEKIINRHPGLKKNFTKFHFGEIVAAACLAHDIGNPPFGHSGEDAISDYFKTGNGKSLEQIINDSKKWNDLIKFEGNAQGFRIISQLQNPDVQGGLRLTYATLATFTKYPRESFLEHDKLFPGLVKNQPKIYKKFGFFQSEKNIFQTVANEVGLTKKLSHKNSFFWHRHPLAFLVEAADDICYRIMDLEDGSHLGLVSFKETESLLMPLIGETKLKLYNTRDEKEKIGYLRAKSITLLVEQLAEVFLEHEEQILNGNFENELIGVISARKPLEKIKKVSERKIYSYKTVIEREAVGYEVLGGLLDIFVLALLDSTNTQLSHRTKTIIKLFPQQFTLAQNSEEDFYSKLLQITDFISGMTDSFAVSLYRKLKGISLPQ
ncbi:MAG: deoxyguanosinetriphosphate triphosphohydrolase [Ignavibacteriaceae bacterium]|nr:deoxyguanosinetriphosphate triphosphohydrolase [Ignavibacteriaceae bacterium]